jgi:NADH:ubiquinone oxidoreductase subunit K
MNIDTVLIIALILFALGLAICLTRKHIIYILMGIELMLNAANLNLLYFSSKHSDPSDAQFFILMIMMVAAGEIGIGLAIALKVRKAYKSINPDVLGSKE